MLKFLSIAGLDPSGGAGIIADTRTATILGAYPMAVVTTQTVQNTLGVTKVQPVTSSLLNHQLRSLLGDITPDCIKIGVVGSVENVKVIARVIKDFKLKNIVLDPILSSSSGASFTSTPLFKALKTHLLSLVNVITPNLPEFQALCGFDIKNSHDISQGYKSISSYYNGDIILTGGHFSADTKSTQDSANDYVYHHGNITTIKGKKIDSRNTHGTGCTYSSALACFLAESTLNNTSNSPVPIITAATRAKDYMTQALSNDIPIGNGTPPVIYNPPPLPI
ncbi:MAG: bifunctional hydroxymethylpyrimidine kinase/phosphomethylpyrimidine kinase [Clostridiales bacterium]|jgi:hydroxymethylpyrimidine/phosphomethylpyrimidine kinase|nr:bifunctional hydroxymethylpyrimidine kinase/phosphomethylpyrimidine kinase [Clostridiales bacterium]